MTVDSGNVEQVMAWLADGSPARSANAAGGQLVQKLAVLVFQGDSSWPNHADRVDAYRDGLAGWLAGDRGRESQFIELTNADADPGVFIDWFLGVLPEWEQWAAHNEVGTAVDGVAAAGLQNPNSDGTPGTEFYRFDEATGDYLYAPTADSTDWVTYEGRRYSEPERDDNYGLDYRLDRTNHVYEWYDEGSGTWKDQTWANLYAARRHDPAAQQTPAGGAQPEWDESWAMFYRVGPGGVYEFADAGTPGDASSGCSGPWLSHEQVLARAARRAIDSAIAAQPQLGDGLTEEDFEIAIAKLTEMALGG